MQNTIYSALSTCLSHGELHHTNNNTVRSNTRVNLHSQRSSNTDLKTQAQCVFVPYSLQKSMYIEVEGSNEQKKNEHYQHELTTIQIK